MSDKTGKQRQRVTNVGNAFYYKLTHFYVRYILLNPVYF